MPKGVRDPVFASHFAPHHVRDPKIERGENGRLGCRGYCCAGGAPSGDGPSAAGRDDIGGACAEARGGAVGGRVAKGGGGIFTRAELKIGRKNFSVV